MQCTCKRGDYMSKALELYGDMRFKENRLKVGGIYE